jgi:peptidoglycan/LPS O-acetylase OafA/YrhL
MARAGQNDHHFTDLDGLRGILALTVCVYHYGLNTLISQLTGGLIPKSPWGICVDFFFILSGFVLCHAENKRFTSVVTFFIRRLCRIWPVHIICLMLIMSAASLSLLPPAAIMANILLIQPLVEIASINNPSWSASYELFIPPLIFLFVRPLLGRFSQIVGMLCLMGVCSTAGVYLFARGDSYELLRAFGSIGLGFTFCCFLNETKYLSRYSNGITVVCTFLLFFVILISGNWPIASLLIVPLSLALLTSGRQSKTFLSWSWIKFLGTISYSLYLIHAPVLEIAIKVLDIPLDGSLVTKLLLLVICVGAATVLTFAIERPAIRFGKSLSMQFGAVTSPVKP